MVLVGSLPFEVREFTCSEQTWWYAQKTVVTVLQQLPLLHMHIIPPSSTTATTATAANDVPTKHYETDVHKIGKYGVERVVVREIAAASDTILWTTLQMTWDWSTGRGGGYGECGWTHWMHALTISDRTGFFCLRRVKMHYRNRVMTIGWICACAGTVRKIFCMS